jgi:hypothetical protein
MSITSLKKQAELALAKLTEGKRFLLSDLNERLRVVADENPQDTVIKAMASVVEQIHNKNPEQLISQGDVEKLYNELVGLNASGTRFREVLGDLLISEGPKAPEANEEYIGKMRDPTEGFLDYDVDSEVKQGFDHFFEPESNKYDPQNAVFARNKVEMELRTLGFDRARVKLAGGNSRFLVFASDLDTNQGAVRVYVPADASGQQLPSVFVAGDRFDELSKPNLDNYISRASFRNERLPEVSTILNSLDVITGNVKKAMNEEEFTKVASGIPESNGSDGLSGPGVFASLPNPSNNLKDVEIPRTAPPEPLKIIASEVEESILETTVGYPQASVRLAKRMLVAELASMGFKGSQIRVAASTADGFICEADLNTPKGKITIELPTEMSGDVPLLPSVFAHGDYVSDFTAPKLQAFVLSKTGENKTIVASDSSLYGLNLSQIKDVIVKSAMDHKFAICDEAIEVVAQKFDEETYRNVVGDYYEMLMNLGDVREKLSQSFDDSDQFVKTPNSIYPIHKKLGRPAHDLVRDESGVYHLKSTYDARKKQVEEGAFFSNAKVLVGD